MKLILKDKNHMALACTAIITVFFFIAGLLDVLDYFIVKALLFISFAMLFAAAVGYALKNDAKKNRPEDQLQDDSH